MRLVLVIIVIVLILALFGFVQFQSGSGKAGITVDTEKLENAANEAVESGKELIHDASDSIKRE
jgi:preprotein translocase subunit SecG